jgi:hypothetical protein
MGCSSPRLIVVAAAVALAACGGGSLTGPTAAAPTRTFTVMTYNIQHGLDAAGKYNLQGAIDVISRLQPDIVGLQEVTRNHPSHNCDDQPELLRSGVERGIGTVLVGRLRA